MARNTRISFRGTIWEDALRRAYFNTINKIDETVTCPVPSCRNVNKFFNCPQSIRYHARIYHEETLSIRHIDQQIQQNDEEYDFMDVDQTDLLQVQILNPTLRPNLHESFIIIKHEDNPNFQVIAV